MPVGTPRVAMDESEWISRTNQNLLAYAAQMETGVTPEDARKDPLDFIRYVMQDENGDPLAADDLTRLYVDCFEHCRQHGKHLSVMTPPGFGKTTLALGMLTRCIGRNPKIRTVVVTADRDDSINAVTLARQTVLTTQFKDVYPEARPDIARSSDGRGWRQTHWYMQATGMRKDPTMAAVAMAPKRESMRVDVGLFDDMVTESTCEGVKHAEVVNRFWKTWIEGRCRPRGWAVYQQNVRRLNDLGHQLREDARFCSIWIGVNLDCRSLFIHVWNPPKHFPLATHPERYGVVPEPPPQTHPAPHLRFVTALPSRPGWEPETLEAIHISARKALYHMQAVRSEDLVLPNWPKRNIFNGTAAQMCGLQSDPSTSLPIMTYLDRMKYGIVGGLDLSSTKRPGTALWVLLIDENRHVYPLFLTVGNYDLPQIADILDMLWASGIWLQRLNVEDVGVQDMLVKSLVRPDRNSPPPPWAGAVTGFSTTKQKKWDINLGMPGIDSDMEKGIIHWPAGEARGSGLWAKHWKTFETIAETLTREGVNDKPPDEMMSFLFAREAGRIFGPGTGRAKAGTVKVRRPVDPVLGSADREIPSFKTGKRKKKGPTF